VQDHLGIGVRLEDRAVALHLPAQRLGVREVAVWAIAIGPRAVVAVIG